MLVRVAGKACGRFVLFFSGLTFSDIAYVMFCDFLLVFSLVLLAYGLPNSVFYLETLRELQREGFVSIFCATERAIEQVEVKGDTYTPHIVLKVHAIDSRRTTLDTLALG